MPPLLWPLLSLTAGILASPFLDTRFAPGLIALACLLALARPKLALVALALVGAILGNASRRPPPVTIEDDGLPRRVALRLLGPPEPRANGISFVADVLAVDGTPVGPGRTRLAWFPDDYGTREIFDGLGLGRGDRIEVLVRLRRPTAYRNPGVFDYPRYLERQGIYWVGTVRSPRLIEIVERGWHGADRIRAWTSERIARHFPDPTIRALVLGMVLGQRRLMPPEVDRQFEASGLIHLLVVSGFNLAVVAAVALRLGRALPLGRYQRGGSRVFALVLIIAYASLVEGNAPVWRAALMASLLVIGTALDRGYAVGNALAAAAMLILVLDPSSLHDPSFLLSFGAVAAILLIGAPVVSWSHGRMRPALRDLESTDLDRYLEDAVTDLRVALRLRAERRRYPLAWVALPWRVSSLLAEVALITLSIQALLLPSAVESFHRVAPVAVPLNVMGAVIAGAVTPLGLVLIPLPAFPGASLARVMETLLVWLVGAVDWGLEIPGATFRVPSVPVWLWAAYLGALACFVAAVRLRRALAAGAGLTAAFAAILTISVGDFSPAPPPDPVLTFLDVGQGDSALIELPDGRSFIIDGGGVISGDPERRGGFRVGEDVVSAYLFSRRFRRLDAVVLTHAHHDHMDGLFDLIANFEIGEIWLGPNPVLPRYRELLDTVYAHGIPIRHVRAGDTPGPFAVLSPEAGRRTASEVRNDDSVVLLLEWADRSALFTGDLERDLDDGPERVDVLKVPHHGSRNTRLTTRAGVPVISVGANNRFGHPAPERLPAFRTDTLGAIEVSLRPRGPEVSFPGLR